MLQIVDDDNFGQAIESHNLYDEIGLAVNQYNRWCKGTLLRYGNNGNDFYLFNNLLQSSKGRNKKLTIYRLTVNFSKELCMIARTQKAKELRQFLINLHTQHQTGYSFTTPQIEGLIDLSRAITLISIQKDVEKKHFDIYNDKYTWYDYRAKLLGYSTKNVIEAMQKVNKKHHSLRTSLIQLDANELIRVGVIDFMMALGKSPEYATNVGNLCKSISSKAKFGNIIWDDTIENPLKLNQGEINERKESFEKTKTDLKYLI